MPVCCDRHCIFAAAAKVCIPPFLSEGEHLQERPLPAVHAYLSRCTAASPNRTIMVSKLMLSTDLERDLRRLNSSYQSSRFKASMNPPHSAGMKGLVMKTVRVRDVGSIAEFHL